MTGNFSIVKISYPAPSGIGSNMGFANQRFFIYHAGCDDVTIRCCCFLHFAHASTTKLSLHESLFHHLRPIPPSIHKIYKTLATMLSNSHPALRRACRSAHLQFEHAHSQVLFNLLFMTTSSILADISGVVLFSCSDSCLKLSDV
jgi:hypothetical protein